MHPLITDLAKLKDSEIENKIQELTRKYFMSHNFELQQQVALALDTYKNEMAVRKQAEWQRAQENRNKDLDKLINVS